VVLRNTTAVVEKLYKDSDTVVDGVDDPRTDTNRK
jgi:hypothetical protein